MAMEQGTKDYLYISNNNKLSSKEKKVCEILLNLSLLINISELGVDFPVWGAKKRRLPRHHHLLPDKKLILLSRDSSPATTLSFPPSDHSDDTVFIKVHKNKTKEELLSTLKELVETKEILKRELEKVKTCHNERKAYNALLKAKQEEFQIRGKETNSKRGPSLNLEMELSKSLNLETELNQNMTPFSFSVENHHAYYPNFLTLIQQQQQHQHNYIFHYPCRPGLPDLNTRFDEVENLQPLDRNVQSHRDDDRQRAAKARKRRIVRLRERKLNLFSFKTSKC